MQTKPHTMLATALAGIVIALTVAPAAFSNPASRAPAFPSAVPAQPGFLTGSAASSNPARAQQQYFTSYGKPQPLARPESSAASSGVDWAAISISFGACSALIGALIALVAHTRRRTHRVRAVA